MSIYPVPLQKWFPNPKHNRKHQDWKSYEDGLFDYEILRSIVEIDRCSKCGKHCKYNRAWGHHSLPFGHGEVYCSEKCLYGPKKKRRARRYKKLRGRNKRLWSIMFSDTIERVQNAMIEEIKANGASNKS